MLENKLVGLELKLKQNPIIIKLKLLYKRNPLKLIF